MTERPNPILDPTGRGADPSPEPGAGVLAPRRPELTGLRIGVLENTKKNADLLLTELARLLVDEHGAAGVTVARTKRQFAVPAPDELIEEYARGCDVVVTGVGDCGSCSASAVADGVLFERAGVPAAVICSDAFAATADTMAALRGATGYRYLTTPHPVAILEPDQVRDRAARLAGDVAALLTGAQR
ncbi:UGSC family (seleno)protein [Pseudonocardia sp. ICBG1293]|uniref:UGSC family (seleno)protein n=1 Tax=Pseudonocardia sp. ICBG1293 TaxID=2844382 RepID=UPI001CCFC094|nr:UGSC family (seleno)protein [Pseudonocardia sp. ICBG1293]